MKSRPTSSPAALPPSEQVADTGQPRPRPGEARHDTEDAAAELPSPNFDLRNEPSPLTVPETEKLLSHANELIAIGEKLTRQNDALCITIQRLGAWLLAQASLLSATGADISGLVAIVAESIAAAKASLQEPPAHER